MLCCLQPYLIDRLRPEQQRVRVLALAAVHQAQGAEGRTSGLGLASGLDVGHALGCGGTGMRRGWRHKWPRPRRWPGRRERPRVWKRGGKDQAGHACVPTKACVPPPLPPKHTKACVAPLTPPPPTRASNMLIIGLWR